MSKSTAEIEIKISGGRITNALVFNDGTCRLVFEPEMSESKDKSKFEPDEDEFALVEASKLSLEDDFMKHEVVTGNERDLKELLTKAIQHGVKDFYRPKFDPTFNKAMTGFCFIKGMMPAVGRSCKWWKERARAFAPEYGSRLGTQMEYVAFLGVLIKKMVRYGWSIADAWDKVCNNSSALGHYWNSNSATHQLDSTCKRTVCGFFDLGNTLKILAVDEKATKFVLGGGNYLLCGHTYPLSHIINIQPAFPEKDCSTGWIVIPA